MIFFFSFIKIFLGNLVSKLIIVKLFGFVIVNWKDFLIVLLLFLLFLVWIILFKCLSIFFFIGFFIKVFIIVLFMLKGFFRSLYIFFFCFCRSFCSFFIFFFFVFKFKGKLFVYLFFFVKFFRDLIDILIWKDRSLIFIGFLILILGIEIIIFLVGIVGIGVKIGDNMFNFRENINCKIDFVFNGCSFIINKLIF